MISGPIKLISFKFSRYQILFRLDLPEFRNTVFSDVSEFCNSSTEIFVETAIFRGALLDKMGVPKVDSLTCMDFVFDDISYAQKYKFSDLDVGSFDILRNHFLPKNAMTMVTSLRLRIRLVEKKIDSFFTQLFPSLKVLELDDYLDKIRGQLQLPDSCKALYTLFDNLQYVWHCKSIQYLGLDGNVPLDLSYCESELTNLSQFSLHGLNVHINTSDGEECGDLGVLLKWFLKVCFSLRLFGCESFISSPTGR